MNGRSPSASVSSIRRATLACVAMLAAMAPAAAAGDLSGREIIVRMQRARLQGSEDASSVFRLELRSRSNDEMTRTVAMYRRQCGDESRNLVVFREPADVSGAALLTAARPNERPDMWMYLPELGRVRQLNAFAQSERFMGSDLSYEDLGAVAIDGREHHFLTEATLEGEPVYKVYSVPKFSDVYGRVVTWVSRETFLPARIDYFDRVGVRLKTARFTDVRTIRGIPTPFSIEIEDADTGHRTLLTLLSADYFRGLDCDLFREKHLTRFR
jgi:hypothetical protein